MAVSRASTYSLANINSKRLGLGLGAPWASKQILFRTCRRLGKFFLPLSRRNCRTDGDSTYLRHECLGVGNIYLKDQTRQTKQRMQFVCSQVFGTPPLAIIACSNSCCADAMSPKDIFLSIFIASSKIPSCSGNPEPAAKSLPATSFSQTDRELGSVVPGAVFTDLDNESNS